MLSLYLSLYFSLVERRLYNSFVLDALIFSYVSDDLVEKNEGDDGISAYDDGRCIDLHYRLS